MKRLMVMTILATQWVAASAMADCVYQGTRYTVGQKHVAGGICQADGTWKCASKGKTYSPGSAADGATCQPDGTWG